MEPYKIQLQSEIRRRKLKEYQQKLRAKRLHKNPVKKKMKAKIRRIRNKAQTKKQQIKKKIKVKRVKRMIRMKSLKIRRRKKREMLCRELLMYQRLSMFQ